MALIENRYANTDALNKAFARKIITLLSSGIRENGTASLIVSGGRTPVALFKALSHASIDWSKVNITLADERWVDGDDDASNAKLVRANLLVNNAANANFIDLKTEHQNAEDAVQACTEMLEVMQRPFDVLILGMGEDGHTASLFPCSEQIHQGLDLDSANTFIAVQPKTAPNQRMSLTLPALLDSKNVFLHLTGEAKKNVIKEALSGSDEAAMPIRAVINNTDVVLVWAP